MTKKIGIIGGGFAGTMTAVQIIYKATSPCEIYIVSEKEDLNKGVAYNPYSKKHILNVTTGKMSAFPDKQDDFLDFVASKEDFKNIDKTLISNSFLSRKLYGEYLVDIWQKALIEANSKNIKVVEVNQIVNELILKDNIVTLVFNLSNAIDIDICVIATGNQVPKNPTIKNLEFYTSKDYFQNPWKENSVQNISNELPVLIVGNGLTMVDTIIGLREQNFKGEIYSISPNGFNILPHRHSGLKYTAHLEEIYDNIPLSNLVKILNKHIKIVREFGVSAEPIIDALRPLSHKIWRSLSTKEKTIFMSRLRHLFGVARHRIPLHIYDKIQKLRIDGTLHIQSGKLLDIVQQENKISVTYFDKKDNKTKVVAVSRVINCTGPETDFSKLKDSFLSSCINQGLFQQDELKLGLKTDVDTFQVFYKNNEVHHNIYTLGSNLKGELWETTAVNELRQQAKSLAENIVKKLSSPSDNIQVEDSEAEGF